LAGT